MVPIVKILNIAPPLAEIALQIVEHFVYAVFTLDPKKDEMQAQRIIQGIFALRVQTDVMYRLLYKAPPNRSLNKLITSI